MYRWLTEVLACFLISFFLWFSMLCMFHYFLAYLASLRCFACLLFTFTLRAFGRVLVFIGWKWLGESWGWKGNQIASLFPLPLPFIKIWISAFTEPTNMWGECKARFKLQNISQVEMSFFFQIARTSIQSCLEFLGKKKCPIGHVDLPWGCVVVKCVTILALLIYASCMYQYTPTRTKMALNLEERMCIWQMWSVLKHNIDTIWKK